MFRYKHPIVILITIALAAPFIYSLGLGSPLLEGRPPAEVFSGIENEEFTATYDHLEELAAYAASRKNNVFEFLRDISLHLAKKKSTVRILGNDLRKVGARFALGNDVVKAILPLDNVVEIRIGNSNPSTESARILVDLDRPDVTTGFRFVIFSVVLRFEKTYGIDLVSEQRLEDIHGVQAERLGDSAQVLAVKLIRNTRIAVELDPGPNPTASVAPILRKRGSR